jgi:hypothetical protein
LLLENPIHLDVVSLLAEDKVVEGKFTEAREYSCE